MTDSLLLWLQKFCENGKDLSFSSPEELSNGILFAHVISIIDGQPLDSDLIQEPQSSLDRVYNLFIVYRRLEDFFTNVLQQIVMLPPPNLIHASQQSSTEQTLIAIRQILLLILGCASQSARKEEFLQQMDSLPDDVQDDLMQTFTELAQHTMTSDESKLDHSTPMYTLFVHLKQVCFNRTQVFKELMLAYINTLVDLENFQLVVEDNHSRLGEENALLSEKVERFQRQLEVQQIELEETKRLLDGKVKNVTELQKKLSDQDRKLASGETQRSMPAENEEEAAEVYRLRQQLSEMHFFRTRVQELRDANSGLIEEKQKLEDLLANSRKKEEDVIERLVECQMKIDELQGEREIDRRKVLELIEVKNKLENEISHLQQNQLPSVNMTSQVVGSGDSAKRDALIRSQQRKVMEMEREMESLKTRLMEAQRQADQKEEKWKFLDVQKEKLEARREAIKLRDQINVEKDRYRELESKKETLDKEKEQLQCELTNLQTNYEAHTRDMEAKVTELSNQVLLLRRKGAKLANVQQFREMELVEKELMYQSVQELTTQVSRLKHHNNILRQSCDKLKSEVDKILAIEEENERLMRENRDLRRAMSSQNTNDSEMEELRKRNLILEVENKKLRKIIESLRVTLVQIDPYNKLRFHYITSI